MASGIAFTGLAKDETTIQTEQLAKSKNPDPTKAASKVGKYRKRRTAFFAFFGALGLGAGIAALVLTLNS